MSELGLERIVVVRALKGLGDFLCVTPALRSLRYALPDANITLLGQASTRSLVRRYPHLVDEFLPFPGFPGIPEESLDVSRLPGFFAAAQARRFDLAIQMHGKRIADEPVYVMLGAAATAGYHAPGAYCPDPDRFLPLSEDEHEVRRWLRLLDRLGIPPQGEDLEFPLMQSDSRALAQLPESAALLAGGHVVLHAGASEPARRWLPANFAAVADYLAATGLAVVLTGTSDEASIAADVARAHALPRDEPRRPDQPRRDGCDVEPQPAPRQQRHRRLASCVPPCASRPSSSFLRPIPRRWAPLDRSLHRVVGADGLQPDDVFAGTGVGRRRRRSLRCARGSGRKSVL